MRTIYTTLELLSLLRSSDREPSPASPFRALMTLNAETEARALTEEQRLLCAFALNPERTILLGRHSAADGTLYLLNIGPIWYLYTWLEAQDRHVFEAFFDRPRLLKLLQRNFCGYYQPNFSAFTQLSLRMTRDEFVLWNLIRALYASRARKGTGNNEPFTADDLKASDLGLYLRNYLDELGMKSLADTADRLLAEKTHDDLENALKSLEEKGILTQDLAGVTQEKAYRQTRTALERLDDGMLTDTVWYADRTDPEESREMLLCLRRDGVLALIPTDDGGVALRTFSDLPWEELI